MKTVYPRSQDFKSGLYFVIQASCYTLDTIQKDNLPLRSKKFTGVCLCVCMCLKSGMEICMLMGIADWSHWKDPLSSLNHPPCTPLQSPSPPHPFSPLTSQPPHLLPGIQTVSQLTLLVPQPCQGGGGGDWKEEGQRQGWGRDKFRDRD